MFDSPVRRAQIIAPFGVGALLMTKEGVSLIGAGLDHWFDEFEDEINKIDLEEFYVEEWRLQKSLDVDFFRMPPDFREPFKYKNSKNINLKIPYLRFPTWHFCQRCGHMTEYPLTERGDKNCDCKSKGAMVQVPIIVICDRGHIQDFPWREWVHRSLRSECKGGLKFKSTGVGGLRGLTVACRKCEKYRNLEGVLSAEPSGQKTILSSNLDKNQEYLCTGCTPWLYEHKHIDCKRPLRGALRSSTNIYYAQLASAIYLPRAGYVANPELVDLVTKPPISQVRQMFGDVITGEQLKKVQRCENLVKDYTDDQINEALAIAAGKASTDENYEFLREDKHTSFRRREFDALLQKRRDDQLIVSPVPMSEYASELSRYFSNISLVEKLRETRVLRGFTRVYPENDMDNAELQDLMRTSQAKEGESWLPAYVVYGEGVFIKLNEEWLQEWEKRDDVRFRVQALVERYKKIQEARHLQDRSISSRFILVHTLAHLLIDRLTFESGYGAASLRERLFISQHPERPMAGLLLYTAAGDSEGTMGGLVRLGRPGFLEPIFHKAIKGASWCGADPVCMESGDMGGQGPDSCNLAACHNCALVPETTCEEFNRFLDRGLVIGSLKNQNLGFFNQQ